MGDLNVDGVIDAADLGLLMAHWTNKKRRGQNGPAYSSCSHREKGDPCSRDLQGGRYSVGSSILSRPSTALATRREST